MGTKYRKDGLCPRCGERPVYVSRNGRKRVYCKLCEQEYQIRRRHYSNFIMLPPCPTCDKNDCYVTPSGYVAYYCAACKAKWEKRRVLKQRKAVQS